jgi:hypothetical protein
MIMPSGNATISVECVPESDVPRKFEEVNISEKKILRNFFILLPRKF